MTPALLTAHTLRMLVYNVKVRPLYHDYVLLICNYYKIILKSNCYTHCYVDHLKLTEHVLLVVMQICLLFVQET